MKRARELRQRRLIVFYPRKHPSIRNSRPPSLRAIRGRPESGDVRMPTGGRGERDGELSAARNQDGGRRLAQLVTH